MATMTPKDFRRWRKVMDLSQKDAAEALGLKRRVVQYYEKGERDGEKVEIPKYVRLACFALLQGVKDYKGPPKEEGEESLEPVAEAVPESDSAETPASVPAPAEGKPKAVKGRGKPAGKAAGGKAAGKATATAASTGETPSSSQDEAG